MGNVVHAVWSLPLTDVTDSHLQDFLEAVRRTKIDGSPQLPALTTIAAARTPVRAAFRNAHQRCFIDWNPGKASSGRSHPTRMTYERTCLDPARCCYCLLCLPDFESTILSLAKCEKAAVPHISWSKSA